MKKVWISYPRRIFRRELALGLIKKYVPRNARFLDIGCGGGEFGIALSQIGFSGKMIDFSEEAGQIVEDNLEESNITNLQFEKRDFFDLSDGEEFDLAVAFEVLEHLQDDKKALIKINSLLGDGGFLLISVPAHEKLWGVADTTVGHFRRYEKKELARLLEETGFKTVVLDAYGYPFLNIIRLFRNLLLRRTLRGFDHKDKAEGSKISGLDTVKLPSFFGYVFNKYTLLPFIQFSKLFNRFDLTEGYLCLAQKHEKK